MLRQFASQWNSQSAQTKAAKQKKPSSDMTCRCQLVWPAESETFTMPPIIESGCQSMLLNYSFMAALCVAFAIVHIIQDTLSIKASPSGDCLLFRSNVA